MPINRSSFVFILAIALAGSLYWFLAEDGTYSVEKYVQNGDLLTLETRFTADEIIEKHKNELIGNSGRSFQEPVFQFHPYLLLNVKYYDKNHKTKQGAIIWSQMDGELVLNTETWEQTRGFADTINANATPLEFRVLNALADNKGTLFREKLQKDLSLEIDPLNALLDSLKHKQLIVLKGNEVSLHFENPKFNVPPQTKMTSSLVTKPNHQGKRLSAKYGKSKIERIAKAAFGNEFTIIDSEEIYLPVLRIPLLNPDGSVLITDWNAITGDKINLGPVIR
jgi:hypothetical protein